MVRKCHIGQLWSCTGGRGKSRIAHDQGEMEDSARTTVNQQQRTHKKSRYIYRTRCSNGSILLAPCTAAVMTARPTAAFRSSAAHGAQNGESTHVQWQKTDDFRVVSPRRHPPRQVAPRLCEPRRASALGLSRIRVELAFVQFGDPFRRSLSRPTPKGTGGAF